MTEMPERHTQRGAVRYGTGTGEEKRRAEVDGPETDVDGIVHGGAVCVLLHCDSPSVYGGEHHGSDHGGESDRNDTGAGGYGHCVSGVDLPGTGGGAGVFRRRRGSGEAFWAHRRLYHRLSGGGGADLPVLPEGEGDGKADPVSDRCGNSRDLPVRRGVDENFHETDLAGGGDSGSDSFHSNGCGKMYRRCGAGKGPAESSAGAGMSSGRRGARPMAAGAGACLFLDWRENL